MRYTAKLRAMVGLLGASALVLAGCGSSSDGGDGDSVTLVHSGYVSKATVPGQIFAWWAEEVEKRTDGRVTVEQNFDATLLAPTDTLAGVRDGRVDIANATEVYQPAELPLAQVAAIPFVSDDPEAQLDVLADMYDNNDPFREQYDKLGIRVLFFLPIGTSTIASGSPISDYADLDGLSVRAVGSGAEALKAGGAQPVGLAVPELYEALERKTIEAVSGLPLDTVVGLGLQEVAPHVLDDGMGLFATSAQVINQASWEALSDEDQRILAEVSEEARVKGIELLIKTNESACSAVEEAGGSVTPMPEAELEAWKSAVGDQLRTAWTKNAVKAGYSDQQVTSVYDAYLNGSKDHVSKQWTDKARACN